MGVVIMDLPVEIVRIDKEHDAVREFFRVHCMGQRPFVVAEGINECDDFCESFCIIVPHLQVMAATEEAAKLDCAGAWSTMPIEIAKQIGNRK